MTSLGQGDVYDLNSAPYFRLNAKEANAEAINFSVGLGDMRPLCRRPGLMVGEIGMHAVVHVRHFQTGLRNPVVKTSPSSVSKWFSFAAA